MLSHATVWDFHAPAWATNMSPIFVYFKAHPRGFEWGAINGTSEDIIQELFWGEGKRRRKGNWSARLENIGFTASHPVFFILYPHDFEF